MQKWMFFLCLLFLFLFSAALVELCLLREIGFTPGECQEIIR